MIEHKMCQLMYNSHLLKLVHLFMWKFGRNTYPVVVVSDLNNLIETTSCTSNQGDIAARKG